MLAAASCTFVIRFCVLPASEVVTVSPRSSAKRRDSTYSVVRSGSVSSSGISTVSPSSAASQSFCASALLKSTPVTDSTTSFFSLS